MAKPEVSYDTQEYEVVPELDGNGVILRNTHSVFVTRWIKMVMW